MRPKEITKPRVYLRPAKEMTLDDFIHSFPHDLVFYIGSHSGYFFCGTIEEYERDIDDISRLARRAIVDLKRRMSRYEQYKDVVDMSRYEHYKDVFERATQMLAEFKPLRSRTVLDCYKKDMPFVDNEIAIIVNGYEVGKFWLKPEYDAWREQRLGGKKSGRKKSKRSGKSAGFPVYVAVFTGTPAC